MQVAAFTQSDELLDDWTHLFCFRKRRYNLLMLDERSCHVSEHRFTVA